MKRVIYTNKLDGTRRVLAGQLTQQEAERVAAAWGDPCKPLWYLGPVAIEDCDGTADGEVLKRAA